MAKKRNILERKASPAAKVNKINFKYLFPETYNPQYANGAHGGATSQGEVALNFFVERHPIPHEETYAVAPDGRLGESLGRSPQVQDGTITIVRYVTTGIIVNRESAKRIYEFLGRAIANLETAEAAKTAIAMASAKTGKGAGKKLSSKG